MRGKKSKECKNIKLSRIMYDRVRNRNNNFRILTDYLTFEWGSLKFSTLEVPYSNIKKGRDFKITLLFLTLSCITLHIPIHIIWRDDMLLLISDGLGIRILCNFTKILSNMLNQKNKQTQIFWNKGYSSFFPQIFGICTYFWYSNYLEKNEENPGSTFHSRVIFH